MAEPRLREAWVEIRKLVESAYRKHLNDFESELCPWGGDATEYPEAWNYIETVLQSDWDGHERGNNGL